MDQNLSGSRDYDSGKLSNKRLVRMSSGLVVYVQNMDIDQPQKYSKVTIQDNRSCVEDKDRIVSMRPGNKIDIRNTIPGGLYMNKTTLIDSQSGKNNNSGFSENHRRNKISKLAEIYNSAQKKKNSQLEKVSSKIYSSTGRKSPSTGRKSLSKTMIQKFCQTNVADSNDRHLTKNSTEDEIQEDMKPIEKNMSRNDNLVKEEFLKEEYKKTYTAVKNIDIGKASLLKNQYKEMHNKD